MCNIKVHFISSKTSEHNPFWSNEFKKTLPVRAHITRRKNAFFQFQNMNSNWLRGSTRGITAAAVFTIATFDALAISIADEGASDGIDEAADIDWLEI